MFGIKIMLWFILAIVRPYKATSAGVYKMRAQLGSCGTFSIPYTVTTPCREGETLMSDLNLNVYPNPFHDFVKISFNLSEDAPVTVKLFDISGKLIDVILDKSQMSSGESTIDYSTSHLAGGVYILEVSSPNTTQRIKIVSSR
ncbi:MAG: T9SS type A sorting domain-containing protein [Bacteroidetes bacterium]|nr:T9SS type A sorting domain-containing protein [Bacteroidota bacterium]